MLLELILPSKDTKENIKNYLSELGDKISFDFSDIVDSEKYIVKCEAKGDSKKVATILFKIKDHLSSTYKVTIITNEVSAYFNKRLYPLFNDFERKLRKLLYIYIGLNDELGKKLIDELEEYEFGDLFDALFTDSEFITASKKAVNSKSWQFSKAELLSSINSISENTLWDKAIGKESVPTLRKKYVSVRKHRNAVMHAHNIDYKEFCSAINLIKKINKELDAQINKMIIKQEHGIEIISYDGIKDIMRAAVESIKIETEYKSFLEQLKESGLANEKAISESWRKLQEYLNSVEYKRNINAICELNKALAAETAAKVAEVSKTNKPVEDNENG